MPFDLEAQEVAQRRHVDESQLTHLLHVGVGEVLNASHSETTLGADHPLRKRDGDKRE